MNRVSKVRPQTAQIGSSRRMDGWMEKPKQDFLKPVLSTSVQLVFNNNQNYSRSVTVFFIWEISWQTEKNLLNFPPPSPEIKPFLLEFCPLGSRFVVPHASIPVKVRGERLISDL